MTNNSNEGGGSGAPIRLFETRDVARLAGVTPASIRGEAAAGRLVPIAVTPRGVRLFDRAGIDVYLAQRAERRCHASDGETA